MFGIDWKNFNLKNVLEGCGNLFLDVVNLNNNDEIKNMSIYRLNICNNCEINVNGRCYRDWDESKDSKNLTERIHKKYRYSFNTEQEFLSHIPKVIDEERDLYIKENKKHTLNKGKAYLGCGCSIKCKSFTPNSGCPANKWQAVQLR